MALNHIKWGLALVVWGVRIAHAMPFNPQDKEYLTIAHVSVSEISVDNLNHEKIKTLYQQGVDPIGLPNPSGIITDRIDQVGRIITVARDIVALGEDIYKLVLHGKPSNTTTYIPISVIPMINKVPVDILDTEKWVIPVKRTYQIAYKNKLRMEVVKFRYSVIYSYGGSYMGKGAYLTAAQIVPDIVNTMFGFDFTATMKLGGIQNMGTKDSPIAAATLLMEHTVSNILQAHNEVDIFHITGTGGFKKYQR